MHEAELEKIRKILEDEKTSIERQLSDYGAIAGEEGIRVDSNEGFADSAQATAERAQVLAMVDRLQDNYAEVVAALKRMEKGTYGRCERCGQEIPSERLELRPTARLCVRCKQAVGK